MFKPAWMLLAAAVFAAGCVSEPVEPSQQVAPVPVVAPPPAPVT